MLVSGSIQQIEIDWTLHNGTPANVTNPTMQVFNEDGIQIGTDIDITNFAIGVGSFLIKYPVPMDTKGPITFRIFAEGLDGFHYENVKYDYIDYNQFDPMMSRNSDKVRALVYDINDKDVLLSNKMINFLLTTWGNIFYAAAAAAEMIGAKFAATADSKEIDGKLKTTYTQKVQQYITLAKVLRTQASFSVKPFTGGISKDRKESAEQDNDLIQPWFTRDMYDNKRLYNDGNHSDNEES